MAPLKRPPPARFVHGGAARARYGERVDRLADFLWEKDPLADAVVEEIAEMPAGEGWRTITHALAHGIEKTPNAPTSVRAFMEVAERVPVWLDWETVDRAGDLLIRGGPLGGVVLGAMSLILGYASPGGNKPLALSGRLERQAAIRLNETARFVQAVCRRGGMRPHADGWQITLKVRLMHAQVRRMILRSGKWDAAAWGEPINQHDMGGTTLLFSLVVIEGFRRLGVKVDRDEAEGYMHLWRWVGHQIGVTTEVLPTCEGDGTRLAQIIAATQGEPDDDARSLTRALLGSPFDLARTSSQRKAAERKSRFAMMMSRELVGDEMAEKLGIPRLTARHAMVPVFKRLVRAAEVARTRVPGAEKQALAAGLRYWDRVITEGLASATDFSLPTALRDALAAA